MTFSTNHIFEETTKFQMQLTQIANFCAEKVYRCCQLATGHEVRMTQLLLSLLRFPLYAATGIYLWLEVVWSHMSNRAPQLCKIITQILASSTAGFFREHQFVLSPKPGWCQQHISGTSEPSSRLRHFLQGLEESVEVNCAALKKRLKPSEKKYWPIVKSKRLPRSV